MWGLNLHTTFPMLLVLTGMHRHINPNRNAEQSIPVFLAILRPGEAEALQEQVHPGEAGRISRNHNAPALPLAFEVHIEMVRYFLHTK